MRTFNNFTFCIAFSLIMLIACSITFTQQSNNNAFVFNGESSRVFIEDGLAVNQGEANQNAFQYFNKENSENNNISVQAWVYLIGESSGKTMPIISRSTVDGGESFSLSVEDRFAKFSIGGAGGKTLSTGPIPAFTWVQLTGTYDGEMMKLYFGKDLVDSDSHALLDQHRYTDGIGLFIGKSDEGSFKGLIDEIRLWNIALAENNINGSGGNGNPAEPFPNSLAPYLAGQWSFNEITDYLNSGVDILEDFSDSLNHLRVDNINEIIKSKHPPLFVVNSTGDAPDTNPGDGIADAGNGDITLRAAIQEANAYQGPQTIYFYIQGTGPFIIQPTSALPSFNEIITINATTQCGYARSPVIELDGSGTVANGLTISGGGSTVKGLVINNFSSYGLTLSLLDGNNIEANRISGILISSSGNNINDNTITNSNGDGISVKAGAENDQIGV